MEYFSKNLLLLREQAGLKQSEMQAALGISKTTWGNYETGHSKPNLLDFIAISQYFKVSETDILHSDLSKGNLKAESVQLIKSPNSNPKGNGKGNLSPDFKLNIIADEATKKDKNIVLIPFTDISVAAGSGVFNLEYLDVSEYLAFPAHFFRKKGFRLAVRAKGESMGTTVYDGNVVVIRLLERSEWKGMADDYVFVVTTREGQSFIKRVKNRFKGDFIVLQSDNIDKQNYPNFNLHTDEINNIWEVEFNGSWKLPNTKADIYSKVADLEERMDLLMNMLPVVKHKLK